jgi:hypothetical protein
MRVNSDQDNFILHGDLKNPADWAFKIVNNHKLAGYAEKLCTSTYHRSILGYLIRVNQS